MKDEVAVVMGVGPGLGAALVRRFSNEGMRVVAAARSASKRQELQQGTGGDRVTLQDCDVADPAQVAEAFATADKLGELALVVFNAGAFQRGSVLETEPADFERCWRVGCYGGLVVAQAAARRLTARGRGSILFTGATASLRGGRGFSTLASPKFALRGLVQSLSRELGPEGVHVAHVILDGQINLPGREEQTRERGPDALLDPDAIAANYWHLHCQHPSTWTQELDLRPWVEPF